MERKRSWNSILATFATCLAVLGVAAIGLFFSFVSVSVSGTASLPNGTAARIKGPFSCSENTGMTVIDAGGHVFEFSLTSISVDNAVVAPLDSSVTAVEIDASYRTTSLRVNGTNVPLDGVHPFVSPK